MNIIKNGYSEIHMRSSLPPHPFEYKMSLENFSKRIYYGIYKLPYPSYNILITKHGPQKTRTFYFYIY